KIKEILPPPQVIEGRVTLEDTGKPAAHASLFVQSHRQNELGRYFGAAVTVKRADAQGRFKIAFFPGNRYGVEVSPATDGPYLSIWKRGEWPKATGGQKMDFVLPRGGVVQGKVTEASSGKPIAGAFVAYKSTRLERRKKGHISVGPSRRVRTKEDGTFQL